MRVLILCTGNSCRSQIAEAFLKSFDATLEVFSAGTQPSQHIHPKCIDVMKEIGISMENNMPKNVQQFLAHSFDYVITVCDNAKETCPCFFGNVQHHLHIGFEDPTEYTGSEIQILNGFRKIRDEIRNRFYNFYIEHLTQ
jgi:arsenate reductase